MAHSAYDADYCCRRSSVVCVSVCVSVCLTVSVGNICELCKTAQPIEMPFGGRMTRVRPRNHVLDGVRIPHVKGATFVGCPAHSKA